MPRIVTAELFELVDEGRVVRVTGFPGLGAWLEPLALSIRAPLVCNGSV